MLLLAAHRAQRACACFTILQRVLPPCWVILRSRPALVITSPTLDMCRSDLVLNPAIAIAGSLHARPNGLLTLSSSITSNCVFDRAPPHAG
jgi:hypothetical protein